MNIFFLDPDPKIAASMHCDQHLHKMILESAQMLSTAAHVWFPQISDILYKSSYANHPCTQWVRASTNNALWVSTLAIELDEIRQSLGSDPHLSIRVVREIHNRLEDSEIILSKDRPIFCGPAYIKLDPKYPTVPDKYRRFYLHKAKQWALNGKPRMSYKNRSIPEFLKDCEYVSMP